MGKETFYFSHDYNVRTDSKIKKLITKHKYLGYGLFWAIIEDLYNNANALPLDYEGIAYDLRTNATLIKSIINDFDLFVIKGEFFKSNSVQRRLDERNEKSLKARKSAVTRWNNKKNNANALRTECDSNAIKESKVKEKKVNNIGEIDFSIFWEAYNKKVGDKYKCAKKWQSLPVDTQKKIIEILPKWKQQFSAKQYQPYPATFFNQERWNDELPEKAQSVIVEILN